MTTKYSIEDFCIKHRLTKSALGRVFGISRNTVHDRERAGYVVITDKQSVRLERTTIKECVDVAVFNEHLGK